MISWSAAGALPYPAIHTDEHPPEALRAFPPLSHCCAMRAGGRSPRCGAALARLPWPWAAPVAGAALKARYPAGLT
ncbi:hypothetical protein C8240_13210 [Paracidovorax cattleyae]|nr:hypothetical protein C8240_13210 [Paracidovorax cattleyae]